MLRNHDDFVRGSAAQALGSMVAAEAVPCLVKMLRNRDLDFREAAIAIRNISYRNKLYVPKGSKPWKRKPKRDARR